MTCPCCADRGVFKVCYHDGESTDYALCLCPSGEQMRRANNCGKPCTPHWQVWAHQQGIDLERVAPMEDLLTDEEMAARGFHNITSEPTSIEAIAAAARHRHQGLKR